MKKVIKEAESNTINILECNYNQFYGATYTGCVDKAFLVKTSIGYIWKTTKIMYLSENWLTVPPNIQTLNNAIKYTIEKSCKVYQFETAEELFAWLAKPHK